MKVITSQIYDFNFGKWYHLGIAPNTLFQKGLPQSAQRAQG
jgi:hypothetical protein